MAPPPTIPTSFVPHPASSTSRQFRVDFIGAFGLVAYVVLVGVIAVAVGVFFYGRVLTATLTNKDAELATAQAAIDATTAQNFVRLHDRLASSKTLLANHIAYSTFFSAIGGLLPSTVRFTTMKVSSSDTGGIALQGAGIAKNFNALAAASANFATDGNIKNAIFSHIVINKNGSVSFSLAAIIDQKLLAFSPAPSAAVPAPATGTTSPSL